METAHLLISGKVQGVFYRASAKEVAHNLNLRGWIKNTRDGQVEAMITGGNKSVKAFIDWCKTGPRKAEVEEVKVSTQEMMDFDEFKILRSYS